MPDFHTGRLLVATPNIEDPNFWRTVVLLCAHDKEGAFGLVLNHAMNGETVAGHLPEWDGHAVAPAVLFRGGPVSTASVFAMATGDDMPVDRWGLRIAPGLGLVDPGKGPDHFEGRLGRMRFFAGYAGWGAGQLEGEIATHGWFIVDALPDDPFADTPADLWRDVLRRQGGELARFASHPAEPGVN
ncbi:MAG: YqgE/AlgH family protein [Chloroflexi bacterium]|nr:YqgE/AlgH family protein [Chloroflexota bacterium]